MVYIVDLLATQARVETLASHAAPHAAQLFGCSRIELGNCVDAVPDKSRFHVLADAMQRAQRQVQYFGGNIVRLEHHQAIRLLHVRGELGQEGIGGNTDGYLQELAHVFGHSALDLHRDIARLRRFVALGGQVANHLVD